MSDEDYSDYSEIVTRIPFRGYRQYVAFTFIGFNIIGFAVNLWVLYVVAPLLFAPAVKVPKSILFYILSLCVSDLMTMIGMLLLIIEIVFGTWQFSSFACTAYLIFDSMNKFVAPIIVFLISRTCYATVCLDKRRSDNAASLRYAAMQVGASLVGVMCLLWPVFRYSQVFPFYLNPNNETMEVNVMRKCSFLPPEDIEFWFNLFACIISYAVPLFGIVYWYVSVPFFLKRRALTSIVSTSSDNAIRRVITTVLVLTAIYVICWSPYWFTMFFNDLLSRTSMTKRTVVILSYFIHLLPYVSCVAYPVIFTVMNRGIRAAHAKIAMEHRRRFKSITEEATQHFRQAMSPFRNGTITSLRSRFSSYVIGENSQELEKEKEYSVTNGHLAVNANALPTVVHTKSQSCNSIGNSASIYTIVDVKHSISDGELNETETLL